MCASVRMVVSTAIILGAATVQRVSVDCSVKWTTDSICVSCSMLPGHEELAGLCFVCMAATHSCAELTSPCSVGTVAACRCFNGGYFSSDRCNCPSGYGGPYCEVFVGEGKRAGGTWQERKLYGCLAVISSHTYTAICRNMSMHAMC